MEILIFNKLPKNDESKELQEFSEMIGHTYKGYYSEYGKGYILLEGCTEEAEKAYENAIYKSLIARGESEEFAKACAYKGEDAGMCLYFNKECFIANEEVKYEQG